MKCIQGERRFDSGTWPQQVIEAHADVSSFGYTYNDATPTNSTVETIITVQAVKKNPAKHA